MRGPHFVMVVLAAALAACSSSYPTDVAPGVTREGKHLFYYEGPEASAEVDFRLAKYQVGDQSLVFTISLASEGDTVTVDRDAVRVRAPDGTTYVLIDQGQFRQMWGSLRANLERHNPWGPPSDRFLYFRRPCNKWLLIPPGAGVSIVHESPLILNANLWCSGPLVFQVPAGVQPGRWVLWRYFVE